MLRIVEITDDRGAVVEPEWLARAESVHRELRPQLPADYAGKLGRVFAGGGRMVVAVDEETVRGVAVFRILDNTYADLRFYVDDLVTDPRYRSTGVGHALMTWLEARARDRGCPWFGLDSGTHRTQAHKFYFREGLVVTSFVFDKKLG